MAFQNPGKPRFFTDLYQYYRAIGDIIQTNIQCHYPNGHPDHGEYATMTNGDGSSSTAWGFDPWTERHAPFYIGGAADMRHGYKLIKQDRTQVGNTIHR